jgi:hypothetical protein
MGMRSPITKLALALLISGSSLTFAQTAKEDMKQAGSDVKGAAKNTGKATARAARTTGRKVKHTTHKAASKVEEKTRDKN